MNLRTVIAAIGIVTLVGSTAGSALAQNQYQSNVNMRSVAGDIATAIMTLERDQADYNGHRVRGIDFLRAAHRQLRASVAWARSHGYGNVPPLPAGPPPYRGPRYAQGTSDQTLVNVARNIPRWINELNADARDYGGHRVAAISRLQAAQNEINAAIAWFQSHGGY